MLLAFKDIVATIYEGVDTVEISMEKQLVLIEHTVLFIMIRV